MDLPALLLLPRELRPSADSTACCLLKSDLLPQQDPEVTRMEAMS